MMSVPAMNSVLPSSGSQPAKISSSPTANPSVSPLGLPVPPKISVIPPAQITSSPSKPSIGVNHSSVPLSLVYENKVVGAQQPSVTKPSADKPKDLSPAKPTSNGVEATTMKTPPHTQASSTSSDSKTEDASVPQVTTNHSDERVPAANNETAKSEEAAQSPSTHSQTNATAGKVETSPNQKGAEDNNAESKGSDEGLQQKEEEDSTQESKAEKSETKPSQPSKRKREQKPLEKKEEESEPEKKSRRIRSQVLPYQSPLPELATFINKSLKEKDASQKNNEEKLIVFYKNEFLAVRNAEGGFYLCQTLKNVYRSSHRIRIRWLSQKKEESNDEGDIYTPDFYDYTDFECILTTVVLSKMDKNMYKLRKVELERIENILKRALDVEKGVTEKPPLTEEHPDGIDLSLYKDESQLQKPKKAAKRKISSSPPTRKVPKRGQGKKVSLREAEVKPPPAKKAKTKSRSRPARIPTKSTSDKGRTTKRGGRSDPKSKAVDQLKVSPPNEKARVVAKVLRKIDIVPVKEVANKKKGKSKREKLKEEVKKTDKKWKKGGDKKLSTTGAVTTAAVAMSKREGDEKEKHHERRQSRNKHSNAKNKK